MRKWIPILILFLAHASLLRASSETPSLVRSPEPGWAQFRGPQRDGKSDETNLLRVWPAEGPRLIWTATNFGRGFSSPIVSRGKIYTTGDVGEELHIFAHDLAGALVWKATNGAAWKESYPGARASVTLAGKRIFHENAHGVVAAFDAETGRGLWSVDLLKRFGGRNITWGMSECLLVDERAVYAAAGGDKAFLVALDPATGAPLWQSAPLVDATKDQTVENASYASPILVAMGGRKLIIGCSLRMAYCVDAANGAIQWTRPMPTAYSVLSMSPALVGDGVFVTAPHGKGGTHFKLVPAGGGGKIGVEESWKSTLDTCQGSVVALDGKIVGSFYPGRKGWAAIDAQTGAVLYQSDAFVKGAPLYADQRIYALSEDGWMRLLEATVSEFRLHGQFRLAKANNDAWAHPVIHDGRLYLRYHETLSCYDIKNR